jgi:hypothetical protein
VARRPGWALVERPAEQGPPNQAEEEPQLEQVLANDQVQPRWEQAVRIRRIRLQPEKVKG